MEVKPMRRYGFFLLGRIKTLLGHYDIFMRLILIPRSLTPQANVQKGGMYRNCEGKQSILATLKDDSSARRRVRFFVMGAEITKKCS